ncbi:alpha/beta-hydrolase [Athelia psychrophila]|uniref:triacylglycerol lipase n=1 Tax=Athelia psychrophila TaxID=1759441 RepID=A0A166CNJ6_9AGAM|nr:alpha/beta-hydrolase [Fibularhizoctonia sp. CBS 109695]
MYSFLPISIQVLLGSFLWGQPTSPPPGPLRFQLRHQHAVSNSSRVVFSDIQESLFTPLLPESYTYETQTRRLTTHRPSSLAAHASARLRYMRDGQSDAQLWEETEIVGPNVTSRATLQALAKMTNNAYFESGEKGWYDLGSDWNASYPFGWEPEADGFRGHVFVSEDNSTVVISIKGTSAGWLAGGGGPTVKKDQLNDNLLFSCCCARVGPTWYTVCDCYAGGYKCDLTCVQNSLVEDSTFYAIGTNLYNNITYMYPEANIWLIGHSLGGSIASLLGSTFGAPVVAFEAPGEKMASKRLHLPSPPSTQHITHVYHTGDPLAMGTCTGVASVCGIGGYAMESHCHNGNVLRYDTVSEKGWSVRIGSHAITVVVEKLLAEDWAEGKEVPDLTTEDDCVDCFNWEYGDYKEAALGDEL